MNETLHDITLRNFRSYTEASFEFEDGVNIIIGPNASGKTNLLEAIHCICFGKGFKSSDSGLIKHNEAWLRLESRTGSNERSFTLEKDINSFKTKKQNIINGKKISRLGFENIIPVVVFQPDDLRLTTGSPERRRKYIDKLLIQIIPTYKTDLLAYERILKQRNKALKTSSINTSQMFAWNIQLVEKGTKISKNRQSIIEIINKNISDIYSDVADKNNSINIEYSSNISLTNYNENFLSLLEKNSYYDRETGNTSVGPHRDDIIVKLNSRPIKDIGSRGENRTLLLALKNIELELIEKSHNKKPILLLDDVFSELDGLRRKKLTNYIKNKQSILTTTDADLIQKSLDTGNIIAF